MRNWRLSWLEAIWRVRGAGLREVRPREIERVANERTWQRRSGRGIHHVILMGRNAWREPFVMGLEVSVFTTEDQGSATVGGTLGKRGRRAGMGMWRERFLPGNWMSSGEEVERVLVTMIWQRRGWAEM